VEAAGHRPFYWVTPDGYPDTIDYWGGYLIPRWNFGADLMNQEVSGVRVDLDAFAGNDSNPYTLITKIDRALFGGEMSPADRRVLLRYMGPAPVSRERLGEAVGLAIGSPTFQWY
jgi:hypothetical protein